MQEWEKLFVVFTNFSIVYFISHNGPNSVAIFLKNTLIFSEYIKGILNISYKSHVCFLYLGTFQKERRKVRTRSFWNKRKIRMYFQTRKVKNSQLSERKVFYVLFPSVLQLLCSCSSSFSVNYFIGCKQFGVLSSSLLQIDFSEAQPCS